MVHSFTGRKQTFVARDFLVVEVALFAGPGERLEVSDGHFTLRMNKKTTLTASAPSFVAASLKYPDWQPRPTLEAGVGVGNGEVILGRPAQVERFPGDQLPRARLPRAPEQDHGVERQESVRAEEIVLETALPEGNVLPPVSGFLYIHTWGRWRGYGLLYSGPAGSGVLKLR